MTKEQLKRKNLILIEYLKTLTELSEFKIKAEYSTDDNDTKVIVVQEQAGSKVVFYGEASPLYNYYAVDIFGISIEEMKDTSVILGNLIGENKYIEVTNDEGIVEKWQIMFKQFTNPQAIEYYPIRRTAYNMVFQCIVNLIKK